MENSSKVLLESVKTARDSQADFEELIKNNIEFTYDVRRNILSGILSYTLEEIESCDISVIREILDRYSEEGNADKLIEKFKSNYNDDADQTLRGILLQIKKDSLQLLKSQKELTEVMQESSDAMYEETKAKNSKEILVARSAKIEDMKKAIDEMEPGIEKTKSAKMLEAMISSDTFAFLTDRLNDPKEVKSIKDAFFDKQKITLVTNKWGAKIGKYGYEPKSFTNFLRMEEKFLPEGYADFNNLLIFIIMRYVGYTDPYTGADVLKVKSIMAGLIKLVYHKFPVYDNEEEQIDEELKNPSNDEGMFVALLSSILDKFAEYKDFFAAHNIASPNHSGRAEMDAIEEAGRKAKVIAFLKQHRIDGYDESKTADELNEYLQEKIEEMIEEQVGPESTYVKTLVDRNEETGEDMVSIVPEINGEDVEAVDVDEVDATVIVPEPNDDGLCDPDVPDVIVEVDW